jgi:hypothetical protein
MKIEKVIEQPDGSSVKFVGELNGAELDAVITVGLNYLLQVGAIPFLTDTKPAKDEAIN